MSQSRSNPKVKGQLKRINQLIGVLDKIEDMIFMIDEHYGNYQEALGLVHEKSVLHTLYSNWNGPTLMKLSLIEKANKNYIDLILKYDKLTSLVDFPPGLIQKLEEEKDMWEDLDDLPELLWKNCLVGHTYQESLLVDIQTSVTLLKLIKNRFKSVINTRMAKKRLSVAKALSNRLGKDSPLKGLVETHLYKDIVGKGSGRYKQKKTKRKGMTKGMREGVDFKTFKVGPEYPSTCRPRVDKPKSQCKSHNIKKHTYKKPCKKSCNESRVHILNL